MGRSRRGAILAKPRQRESDAKVPNEKLNMEVVMKPLIGTAEANLERAKHELGRVLGFRGDVTSAKVEGVKIIIDFVINPKWDSPLQDKVSYLKEWIPAKTKLIFKVHDVYPEGKAKGKE